MTKNDIVEIDETCMTCEGRGEIAPPFSVERCPDCKGVGKMKEKVGRDYYDRRRRFAFYGTAIKDFNLEVKAKDKRLRQIERKCNKVGMANYGEDNEGFSTLSLIATITDILIDKRLSFRVDENMDPL